MQVGFGLRDQRLLVGTRIARWQLANLVEIAVHALAPGVHPARRQGLVALDALPARDLEIQFCGRLVEGLRFEVAGKRGRLPEIAEGAFAVALPGIVVTLDQRVIELLRRRVARQAEGGEGFIGNIGLRRQGRHREQQGTARCEQHVKRTAGHGTPPTRLSERADAARDAWPGIGP